MDQDRNGTRSFRHIVDVDGLLVGIDPPRVDAAVLLHRANLGAGCTLYRVDGDRLVEQVPGQPIELSEATVAFFRSASRETRMELLAA